MSDLDAMMPLCVALALIVGLLAACVRAGKPFTLAELFLLVALCAMLMSFARFGWLHSLGVQVLLLSTGFACLMTRIFGTRTTFFRQAVHWVVLSFVEITASFVIVNLIYSVTSEPPGDAFSLLFAMLGAVRFFAGLLLFSVVASQWPIRWSHHIAAFCLAFMVAATAWLFVVSTYLHINWW